jgi:hypothetical protein
VLRTRAPLDPKVSFDLHVLGMPPAFVLSQDQTLKFVSQYKTARRKTPANRIASNFGSRYLHLSNVMDTKDI